MARRRRGSGGGSHDAGGERWLLTYADMITLLLALFILLFAMSSIDAKKFDNVRRSLSDSFRGNVLADQNKIVGGGASTLDPSAPNVQATKTVAELVQETHAAQTRQADAEVNSVAQSLRASGLRVNDPRQGDVQVTTTERGVVVRLAGDTFFDSGSATIKPGLAKALRGLSHDLKRDGRPLSVEGHTDGQPMSGGGRYLSNLDLSAGRAIAIESLLIQLGIPDTRMHIAGYGDTKPLVTPKFAAESIAKNRRVEIVIMSSGGANALPTAGTGSASFLTGGAGTNGGASPASAGQGNQLTPVQIIDPITVISP